MPRRVNRPHLKPGIKRVYERDSLSKTKTGKKAVKAIAQVRIKALRANSVNPQSLAQIEKNNADRELTEKQRLFVRIWAEGETPRTAATLAGFSESSAGMGWKLSRDPAILKIYQEEKKLYEEAGKMTRKRVMDMLIESYDAAKMVSEPASMVAAAREIGKMCGYYEPETKINIHLGSKIVDRLNTLSDDQLLEVMHAEGALQGVFERLADDATIALPAP